MKLAQRKEDKKNNSRKEEKGKKERKKGTREFEKKKKRRKGKPRRKKQNRGQSPLPFRSSSLFAPPHSLQPPSPTTISTNCTALNSFLHITYPITKFATCNQSKRSRKWHHKPRWRAVLGRKTWSPILFFNWSENIIVGGETGYEYPIKVRKSSMHEFHKISTEKNQRTKVRFRG